MTAALELTDVFVDYYSAVMESLKLEVGAHVRLGLTVPAVGEGPPRGDGPAIERLPGAGPQEIARYRISGTVVVPVPEPLFDNWWILDADGVWVVASSDAGVAATVAGPLQVLQGYELDSFDAATRARLERLWRVDAIVPVRRLSADGRRWGRGEPVGRPGRGSPTGYLLALSSGDSGGGGQLPISYARLGRSQRSISSSGMPRRAA